MQGEEQQRVDWPLQPLTRPCSVLLDRDQVPRYLSRLAGNRQAAVRLFLSTAQSHPRGQRNAAAAAAVSAVQKQGASAAHSSTSARGQETVREQILKETCFDDTSNVIVKQELVPDIFVTEFTDVFDTETVTTKIEIIEDMCFDSTLMNVSAPESIFIKQEIISGMSDTEPNSDGFDPETGITGAAVNSESSTFHGGIGISLLGNVKTEPEPLQDTFIYKQDLPGVKLSISGNSPPMPDAESQQLNVPIFEYLETCSKNAQDFAILCQSQAEVLTSEVSVGSQLTTIAFEHVLVEQQSENAPIGAWDESEMYQSQIKDSSGEINSIYLQNNKPKIYLRPIRFCDICSKRYTSLFHLKLHLGVVHGLIPYCSKCNNCFFSSKELRKHKKANCRLYRKKKVRRACDICKKVLGGSWSLRQHKAAIHKSEPYCNKCGRIFATFELFQTHSVTCTVRSGKLKKNSRGVCDVCNKTFHSIYQVRIHKGRCHNSEPVCSRCRRFFASAEQLKTHVETCSGNKESRQICDICNKNLNGRTGLRKHKARVHNSEPYCKKCDKFIDSFELLQLQGNLQHHVEICTGNRLTKLACCDICNFNFANATVLRKHKARVHNSEPYCKKCDKFIDSFEQLQGNLQHHVEICTGNQLTKLACCNFNFANASVLRKHKALVHNSEPICKKCMKKFVSLETLQAHDKTCIAKPRIMQIKKMCSR